jgi:excisionase family DNA binding protein
MTIEEAARELVCSRDHVFDLIRKGVLVPTVRDGRKRCVTRESVERRALETAAGAPRGPRRSRAPREWKPFTVRDLGI